MQIFPAFSLFNREFGRDGFAQDFLHRHFNYLSRLVRISPVRIRRTCADICAHPLHVLEEFLAERGIDLSNETVRH